MKKTLKQFLFLAFILTHAYICTALPLVYEPKTVAAVQAIVQEADLKNTHITIQGAGQGTSVKTTLADSVIVNLNSLNNILNLNIETKCITVQSGITWGTIQQYINPFGLSVAAMQSYKDFSVGGSIGVNAHGQDFRFAPVGQTIISLVIVDANGSLVHVSAAENPKLFSYIIGGYGLFGIIVEATIQLTDNTVLEKTTILHDTHSAIEYGISIAGNDDIALYSARFATNKKDYLDKALTITYHDTKQITTEPLYHSSPAKNKLEKSYLKLIRKNNIFKSIRLFFEKNIIERSGIISRNNAMFSSINTLKDSDKSHIEILQEYFIPLAQMEAFITQAKAILQENEVNLVNGTLRLVKTDTLSFLPYAHEPCFALVLFISLDNTQEAFSHAQNWTRNLIDAALSHRGTFYLPYQCFATKKQLHRAYPHFEQLVDIKNKYDPKEIFINDLYIRYQ